eukprot:SAG25_NODE_753_length_5549_cov_85.738532_6_plen_67_part_01
MQLDGGLCGGVLQRSTLHVLHPGCAESTLLAEARQPPRTGSERRLHLWQRDCPSRATFAQPAAPFSP